MDDLQEFSLPWCSRRSGCHGNTDSSVTVWLDGEVSLRFLCLVKAR